MASIAYLFPLFLQFLLLISLFEGSSAARRLNALVQDQPLLLPYHNGVLLNGNISVNLIWYGTHKPSQKAIVHDFISSLSSSPPPSNSVPSVSAWWKTTENYFRLTSNKRASVSLALGDQISVEAYSLGKSLTEKQISQLASLGRKRNAVNVVLTAPDVTVERFCSGRCGTHGSRIGSTTPKRTRFAYIWVGNSESQCPGQCAWPFHQPIYGPQTAPLVAPNGDVGVDGMVINLAGLLASTVTNPFGNGFFQGDAAAPLEAATACPGIYGSNSYPGYPGNLLVDPATGGSYNAQGVGGRRFLLPALYDPATSTCTTLV